MTVGAPPGSSAASSRVRTDILVAGVALAVLALVLRLRGAQGDLWLDEIWSLKLIELMRDGRFLIEGLAVDNNHYLNTLYLFLVGPDASPLAYRGLAILLGIATVPAAGYAMRRSGTAGIVAGMVLFAAAYMFVDYGSEARGYAGLILMTLLAVAFVDEPRSANRLGIVAVIGFLFQPIMVLSLAILGGWVAWRNWRATGNVRATIGATWQLFMPAVAGLIPLAALIGAAVFRSGEYLVAAKTPFSLANFLEGYAGLYRALLGLPDAIPDLPILLVPIALLVAVYRVNRSPRVSLGVIALILVPIAVLVMRPPNVQFPRYYLASGVVFLLLLADLFAEAWRRGILWRGFAALLAAGIALGNAAEIGKLFQYGRGDPLPAMRQIAEAGQPVLVTIRDKVVVEYLGRRYGLQIVPVDRADLCARRPGLMLVSDRDTPETMTIKQPGCAVPYRRVATTPFWGLSGAPWTLYRTAD